MLQHDPQAYRLPLVMRTASAISKTGKRIQRNDLKEVEYEKGKK